MKAVSCDASQRLIGTVRLHIAEAKAFAHHSGHLDQIKRSMTDRAAWQPLGDKGEQIRAGLFIVPMPAEYKASNSIQSNVPPFLDLDLCSNDTPFLVSDTTSTTSNTALSTPASVSFLKTSSKTLSPKTASQRQRQLQQRQKALRRLSQKITDESVALKRADSSITNPPKLQEDIKSLRRIKSQTDIAQKSSSNADWRRDYSLDMEQLSAEFKQIQLKSPKRPLARSSTHTSIASAISSQKSVITTVSEDQVPLYHQIGKGSSPFTFYFNIVHADDLKDLILQPRAANRPRGVSKKPFFSYNFLSTRVNRPAASISAVKPCTWPTCFHLRGHLVDIQKWLDEQAFLEVSLILMDEKHVLFSKETVGTAHVPLTNLAFHRSRENCYEQTRKGADPNLTERTLPVLDLRQQFWQRQQREYDDEIAKITVRLGLVSGWWKGDDDDEEEGGGGGGTINEKATAACRNEKKEETDEQKQTEMERKFAFGTKRHNSQVLEIYDWLKKKRLKRTERETPTPDTSTAHRQDRL